MCRSTAAPLLAIVGVAGTVAGVAIAIVRERVDRLADSRAAKQAAAEQADTDDLTQGAARPDSDGTGFAGDVFEPGDGKPVESESDESK